MLVYSNNSTRNKQTHTHTHTHTQLKLMQQPATQHQQRPPNLQNRPMNYDQNWHECPSMVTQHAPNFSCNSEFGSSSGNNLYQQQSLPQQHRNVLHQQQKLSHKQPQKQEQKQQPQRKQRIRSRSNSWKNKYT